ncbi:MAG: ribosome biogenesis GTPase Der [Alphaproteobacteria bacterium CG_4_10_14_0_8_um_filter_53_9]|nr:MAG: ribosome biogenesis GTPase Der [Alphaproteobacteria bacterium CG_4_10_14_0_8_um_filter_53_9]
MKPTLPTLALIGRPNVGKSTLFNVMSREGRAVVHNAPGTTRDARLAPAALGRLVFNLLDTAGVETTPHTKERIQAIHKKQSDVKPADLTEKAIRAAKKADILLFVIDGASGPLPSDEELAASLRKMGKIIIPIITKADMSVAEDHIPATQSLGFGDPIVLSAEHRMGMSALEDALAQYCPLAPEAPEEPKPEIEDEEITEASALSPDDIEIDEDAPELAPLPPAPLRLAIVGRPNTGKSTLTNTLLRDDAMMTGPLSGLTRDAVTHRFFYRDQEIILTDTPGLRKKAKITEELEEKTVGQTLESIEKADVVLLLVDAAPFSIGAGKWQLFDEQDTKIAATILNQNKTIIVALTKWDLVEDKEGCLEETNFQLARRVSHIKQPLAIPICAPKGKGIKTLLDGLIKVHHQSRQTISTGKLNRALASLLAKNPPPISSRGVIKLKFIRQVMAAPPMLAIWGNRTAQLPLTYQTYLRNQLASACGWENVPLKVVFKAQKNPFSGRTSWKKK